MCLCVGHRDILSYMAACIVGIDTGQSCQHCSHTIESLISEPSLTLGRGQVGEYST